MNNVLCGDTSHSFPVIVSLLVENKPDPGADQQAKMSPGQESVYHLILCCHFHSDQTPRLSALSMKNE